MRTHCLVWLFLLGSLTLQAQVKVGVNATGKHEKAYNTAKAARAESLAQKKLIKRIKDQKKAVKKYKEQFAKMKKKELKTLEIDSLEVPAFTKKDSVALAEKVLTESNFPEKYKDFVRNPMPLDSMVVSSIESSTFDVEKILESKASNLLPEELSNGGTTNPLEGITKNPLEDSQGGTPDLNGVSVRKPSKPNPNLVKPEAARDLFKKIDPKQFEKIQADITKLKKKYSTMPDTRFPEEGRKRNSLEDLPLKKRIFVGGNVNAASTDPFILDSNIQVGYWINKKWLAGTGFILREQFNNRDSISLTGDAHGYSFFMRYDIKKGFYAWGESQRQINKSLLHNSAETNKPIKWQDAHLLGIGREFKLGFVQMTSLMMYDFNYQSNELNARPLVFRLGVQFTKKP
ncbi:MAG: hypothetical protein RIM99_11300 [Cyclobacteriaceae bacterium]